MFLWFGRNVEVTYRAFGTTSMLAAGILLGFSDDYVVIEQYYDLHGSTEPTPIVVRYSWIIRFREVAIDCSCNSVLGLHLWPHSAESQSRRSRPWPSPTGWMAEPRRQIVAFACLQVPMFFIVLTGGLMPWKRLKNKAGESRIWMMVGGAGLFVVLVILFFILASARMHHDVNQSAPPGGAVLAAAGQTTSH